MTSRQSLARSVAERSLTWLLLAALALLLVIVGAHQFKPSYDATLSPQNIRAERGHAFITHLPRPSFIYRLRPKAHGLHKPSTLTLSENGRPLGPGRSRRTEVRSTGAGAFTLRGGIFYFSTSDNSDPRENGRVYSVSAPLFVRRALTVLLLATVGAFMVAYAVLWNEGSRHPLLTPARRVMARPLMQRLATRLQSTDFPDPATARTAYAIVVLTCILAINWFLLGATEIRGCLSPDSGSYLGFSLVRSPFYPAIVQSTHLLTGDIRWLIPLQLNALLLSLAVLGAVVGRLSNSRAWGLAFTLISFTFTPVLLLSYMILTEALFAAFIALHVAMAGLFMKTRFWRHAVLAGLFLAALILMRPAGYSMLLALPLLVWLLRGEPLKVLIGVGGPVVISFVAVSAFNFAKHGTFNAQSYGGLTLLGHVNHLIRPGDGATAGPHGEVVERIAEKMEPIAAPLRSLSFPHDYWSKTSWKYNELLYNHSLPTLNKDVENRFSELKGLELQNKTVEVALAIALATMKAHPWEYVRHALANYYGMWMGLLLDYGSLSSHARMCYKAMQETDPGALSVYERYTDLSYLDDAATARRFELRGDDKTLLRYGWELMLNSRDTLRPLAFALSIVFILLSLRALKDPLILLLSYASFQLNAYFAYMAAITAAIERYSLPFTPILFLILFGTLIVCTPKALQLIRPRRESSRDAPSF